MTPEQYRSHQIAKSLLLSFLVTIAWLIEDQLPFLNPDTNSKVHLIVYTGFYATPMGA